MSPMIVYFTFTFVALNVAGAGGDDADLLLSFRSSAGDGNGVLHTWEGRDPCSGSWAGVTCYRGRVASVRLDAASLAGNVSFLLRLPYLRVLSLRNNGLSGTLPALTHYMNARLKHLHLSHNQLSGALDAALPFLASFRVEHNRFTGGLEGLRFGRIRDFNVSGNRLMGKIADPLSEFPISAFDQNPGLCGSPLPDCRGVISRLAETSPVSSPSPNSFSEHISRSRSLTKAGITVLLAIGVGDLLVIAIGVAVIVGMYLWLRKKLLKSLGSAEEIEIAVSKEKEKGLICFEGGQDLRLDCLLKASAEVLGKGFSGSTYKAVLEDGIIVAVKRLSTVHFPAAHGGKVFDRQMRIIGRVRHPNVVSLRAFCDAHEEKLLVYDYMPNGNLQTLLQRDSTGRTPDWASRKRILVTAGDGLAFIHKFPTRYPLVHANLKPSNILIDEQGNGCVAEWGIMRFAANIRCSPGDPSGYSSDRGTFAVVAAASQRYRAPELASGKEHATQESDVYSFGMMILEVATDKEMDDGELQEEEIRGMVKIAMSCMAEGQEKRPEMSQVVRMMGEFL